MKTSTPSCELMTTTFSVQGSSSTRGRTTSEPAELSKNTADIGRSELPKQVARLNKEVLRLNKRLNDVEKKLESKLFRERPSFFHARRITGEQTWDSTDQKLNKADLSEAYKSALLTVDHSLITSRPYNDSFIAKLRNFFIVMQRNYFAICHFIFMLLALAGILMFGVTKFQEAYDSVQTEFKPFKVKGKDEFHGNEDIHYNIPLHYFVFEMEVSNTSFNETYKAKFSESCYSHLEHCLFRYLESFLIAEPIHMPSTMPTTMPTLVPTSAPTSTPTFVHDEDWNVSSPSVEPTTTPTVGSPPGGSSVFEKYTTNTSMSNDTFFHAGCMMTTSENETLSTTETGLKNFTIFLDVIGIKTESTVLGILLKMELEEFAEHWDGWLMCNLDINMEIFSSAFSDFATYDINFMVSRVLYDSATSGVADHIRSKKRVWRNLDSSVEKLWTYVYEESTFDNISEFAVDTFVETDVSASMAWLNIETYPYHTVVHYISFERYSWTDWIADVGGFYTLVISVFFILSKRVTFFANRKDAFHRRQGILPALSLTYRNTEELSGLRYLVLCALGISEEEYFDKKNQRFLSSRVSRA